VVPHLTQNFIPKVPPPPKKLSPLFFRLKSLRVPEKKVKRVALAPVVGALLLLAGLEGIEARTYRLAWSYQTGDWVRSVSISSDGNYIVAGSDDRRVYLFSRTSSIPLWSYQTGGYFCSVSISSDGNYVAAGSDDRRVYLFSRTSSIPPWSYQTGGYFCSVSISSDGNYVVAGSDDRRVYLFSRTSSVPLWSYQTGGYVRSVSISSDGSYIVAGSDDGRVYLFSRTSSVPLWSYQTGGYVRSVSISSDGNYVAAGSDDGRVYLFSRTSSVPLWSYQTGGYVRSVSISSDGNYVAAGSDDGRIYLFSRTSSIPLWSYQTGDWVRSVSISSDGNYVAAGSDDRRVYLFSRTSSIPLWSYQTGAWVRSVSISSDGSYIVAGSDDRRVYLFSRTSSVPLWSYQTGGYVRSVSISSDGNYVVAGSDDGRVYLLSLNNPPSLSYSLSPTSGTTQTTFTYEVIYSDPDGDAPTYVKVYVDGTGYDMSYVGGTFTSGALYRYSTTLSTGSHTCYFEASDGLDTVRLPPTGIYLGPSVGLAPTSLTISPSSFTLLTGQTLTLTATLTADGTPLPGKTISWRVTAGSIHPSSGLTDSSGQVTAVYTAPDAPTTATITASFAGDAQHGSSSDSSSATVWLQVKLVFTKPDGSPLAYTIIYYGTSQGQETALLGTTDGGGRITLTDPALLGTTVYFRSGDGRYRGSSYVPPGHDGTFHVDLTRVPGRGPLPLVLVLVVGVGIACAVAWRRGLLGRPCTRRGSHSLRLLGRRKRVRKPANRRMFRNTKSQSP